MRIKWEQNTQTPSRFYVKIFWSLFLYPRNLVSKLFPWYPTTWRILLTCYACRENLWFCEPYQTAQTYSCLWCLFCAPGLLEPGGQTLNNVQWHWWSLAHLHHWQGLPQIWQLPCVDPINILSNKTNWLPSKQKIKETSAQKLKFILVCLLLYIPHFWRYF